MPPPVLHPPPTSSGPHFLLSPHVTDIYGCSVIMITMIAMATPPTFVDKRPKWGEGEVKCQRGALKRFIQPNNPSCT